MVQILQSAGLSNTFVVNAHISINSGEKIVLYQYFRFYLLCSLWYCIGVWLHWVNINGSTPSRETFVCIFNCIYIHICICLYFVFIFIFVFVFASVYCILHWGGLQWVDINGYAPSRETFKRAAMENIANALHFKILVIVCI